MEHTYSDDTYDIFTKAGQFQYNPAKAQIGVISTIPATGSETNNIFVVSRRSTNQKLDLVICQHILNLLLTIIKVAQTTLTDHNDYQARANFCYAATVALNLSLNVGVYMCLGAHNIGHELTIHYGVAHGESLALSCPGVMRFNKEKNAKKLIRMAEKVFGIKDAKPEDAIVATENFFKSLGAKTCMSEWNFNKDQYEIISEKFKGKPMGAHKDIDDKAVMTILNDIFN
ncbi:alcohol dehydrogenase [Entamoeba marina]